MTPHEAETLERLDPAFVLAGLALFFGVIVALGIAGLVVQIIWRENSNQQHPADE